ncbi:MAG TPA: adenylate/guanylate cyclase domain-containing protein [Casimicrobiaceae bacterium]|nr:adenylate/guanylate cyclase domain-containing protein [Casimicrobiaceae bacterium]
MEDEQHLVAGIAALQEQRATLGDAVVDAAIAGLRARLAEVHASAGAVEPAQILKQVTILFLDVVGSTALGQRLDPEEIGAVMDGVLSRATSIVEAHGGKVLKYAGDNLLAVFGADGAREDDAGRAVRGGLALLALGKSLGAEIHAMHDHAGVDVRVGIHTGGVLLGGGVDQGESIRGQAVNIAARMEQTAPAGGLRISHDTYSVVRGAFDVAPQEPLRVKGMDAPVRTYLVLSAKPHMFKVARVVEGVATRMIGRDRELTALQDALARLWQSGAGMQRVVVVGEAGVGKSRLLHEFGNWAEARAERHCLFQARATPQTQGQPYGLLHDLIAWRWDIRDGDSMDVARRKLEAGVMPLFTVDDSDAQAEAHLLGQLIGLDYSGSPHVAGIRDDAREIRSRGFHAAAQVLRRIGARSAAPILVQLDDLHWADDGSLDFIDHLVQVGDIPMLLMAFTRPTLFERRAPWSATPATGWSRIDLRPLDAIGSRMLADELLKKLPEIPDALSELVAGRADGNPFYMEELVKMLVERGAIDTTAGQWTHHAERMLAARIPPTLTGVLQARLDGLPPPDRKALQLASVVGLRFWDHALSHVEAPAAARLPTLQARDLVHCKDAMEPVAEDVREYTFDHQILHQVTYDTVLKRVKLRAHARVADWLAHHSGALGKHLLGAAAEHYEKAGDAANAAAFYAAAAEHMAGNFMHDVALEYAARGLSLSRDDLDVRWRLLANRERVLDLLGRRDAQLADIAALDALAEGMPTDADGDARRADAAWRRADYAHRTGDWPTQAREARRAQTLAERASNEPLALRAIQRLAQALAYQGDPSTGQALADAGLARARAAGLRAEESRLLNALTVCTDLLGDRVAGLRYSLQDLSLNRAVGHRRNEAVALSNVGMSYLGFGAFDEAGKYLQEALRTNRALGNRQVEGNSQSILSELAWREGKPALALSHAQAAYDISNEIDSRLHQTDSLWSLGNAELALGHPAEAASAFERSETLAREIGLAPQVLNAIDGQMRVALARGDAPRAQSLTERLLAEARAAALSPGQFSGAYEHLIRLTLYRVRAGHDSREAARLLAEAHALLMVEADRIHDPDLRKRFLSSIAEHREIVERSTPLQRSRQ